MRWAPVSVSMVAYDGHLRRLRWLAALGIEVVELAYIEGYSAAFDEGVFSAANARAVQRALAEAGLTCRAVSAHFDLSRTGGGDALRRRLEFAAAVGAQMVATVPGPAVRRDAFLEHLAQAIPAAEALGVTIALENPADDSTRQRQRMQRIAAASTILVRINYDPGNFLTPVQAPVCGRAGAAMLPRAAPEGLAPRERAGCIRLWGAASCGMNVQPSGSLARRPCSTSRFRRGWAGQPGKDCAGAEPMPLAEDALSALDRWWTRDRVTSSDLNEAQTERHVLRA